MRWSLGSRSPSGDVWAAEADGPGLVGLGELAVTSAKHRQGEIGYAVHLDWWGKGYGEAIARALLHLGPAHSAGL